MMKKRFGRVLALALAVVMAAGLLPPPARAAEVVDSGTCGDNATWSLDSDGLLTISGIGSLDSDAFGGNQNIITVVIEDGITSIEDYSFINCKKLTDVFIPSSINWIAIGTTGLASAFDGCASLTNLFVDGENQFYSSIDGILFDKSRSTLLLYPGNKQGAYTVPEGVLSIGPYSFAGCLYLTDINISSGVTSIGTLAFANCPRLNTITIPDSVTNIEANAFSSRSAGTFVTFKGDAPVSGTSNVFGGVSDVTYRYPYGNTTWDSVVGQTLGADKATWVAYGETNVTAATSNTADDTTVEMTVTSTDLPFASPADPASFTVEGYRVDSADVSPDGKTVTLALTKVDGADKPSVTVRSEAFAGEPVDANGVITNFSVAMEWAEAPDPDPDPTPTPTPGPVPTPTPRPDPDPPAPEEPEKPTTPTWPSYPVDPAPAPPVDPEGGLAPGKDMIPPPEPEPPESPIQGIVKGETGIRDWIDRIDPPEYVKDLYDTLVDGSGGGPGKIPPYLVDDRYFTLPSDPSDADGQEVLYVECVDFELADLYASRDISLGVSVFEDEDFFHVSDDGARADYAALKPGDAVKTSAFNGVLVTSLPKGANFDEEKKTACSYISTVFQAFDRDHPEVFWLSGKCRVRIPVVREADGTERAYFFLVLVDNKDFTMRSPDWVKDGAVADGIQRREKAVETILGTVTAKSPAEIVRQLNRWLTEHDQYNTTPDLTTIGNEPHECLSALEGRIDREGPVCDGYSRAFKVLCDRLNIPCVLENGYAKTSADGKGTFHMWNAVQIGGQWYGVDVTWNDPTVKGFVGAKSGKENEQFLLVGLDTIVRGMTFAASHPANNKASVDGVAFDNGPELSSIAFSAIAANAGLSALPFDDVSEGAWYYGSVAYVYEWGLMMGTAPARFSPGGVTTRQQLWMILARMDGKQPRNMEAARTWAVDRGVSDGTDPGGLLTREQLVTMLYRYCGLKGYEVTASASLSGFTDGGRVSGYARQAMGWAVANEIITGMGDGSISPQGPASRAQLAAMVERVCRRSA